MVRLSAEGREGKFVRDHMMVSLWEDVNKKSKKLGVRTRLMSFMKYIKF